MKYIISSETKQKSINNQPHFIKFLSLIIYPLLPFNLPFSRFDSIVRHLSKMLVNGYFMGLSKNQSYPILLIFSFHL